MKKVSALVLVLCVMFAPECSAEFREVQFGRYYQASRTVSLLTTDEAIKYMPEDAQRRCSPTSYTVSRGAYTNGEGLSAWWTSSPSRKPMQAEYFSSYGTIGNRPHYVDEDIICVRPSVRVNRNAFDGSCVFSVKPSHEKALAEFDMKRLTVEGVVLRKGPDGVFGQPSIELSDKTVGECYVLCVFQNAGDYSRVKTGDRITVRGNYLVIREDYGIVLKICELI